MKLLKQFKSLPNLLLPPSLIRMWSGLFLPTTFWFEPCVLCYFLWSGLCHRRQSTFSYIPIKHVGNICFGYIYRVYIFIIIHLLYLHTFSLSTLNQLVGLLKVSGYRFVQVYIFHCQNHKSELCLLYMQVHQEKKENREDCFLLSSF